MSDLRHDPIDDVWVTMAGNRRSRPMEFVALGQLRQAMICPFCGGNEAEATAPIAVFDADGSFSETGQPNVTWSSRVISNKYPSFSIGGQAEPTPAIDPTNDHDLTPPFQINHEHGLQELIIPTPRHCISISELTDDELEVAFLAIQHRLKTIRSEADIAHAMLFLNCRAEAGASLGHVHWQLIGTPLVSSQLQRRAIRESEHQSEFGISLVENLINWELKQQTRIVCETKNFVVYCPFASRFPFQIHIVPRDSKLNLLDCETSIRDELAWHCRDAVQRLEKLLEDTAYNIFTTVATDGASRPRPLVRANFPSRLEASWFRIGLGYLDQPRCSRSSRAGDPDFTGEMLLVVALIVDARLESLARQP